MTMVNITENLSEIRAAMAVLSKYKLPLRHVQEAVLASVEDEARAPSEADKRWPRDVPVAIEDHLAFGNDRPDLSCRLEIGRSYSLSPGQRDVMRERYGMTPARLVEVTEVAMFKDGTHIRRVMLQSCEHVDLARRHIVKRLVIDDWGHFMDSAKASDDQRAQCHVDDDSKPKAPIGPSAKSKSVATYDQLLKEYAV